VKATRDRDIAIALVVFVTGDESSKIPSNLAPPYPCDASMLVTMLTHLMMILDDICKPRG
jgi:hypothetical protein